MSPTVLLARPHSFIVSDMKRFLEEAGFKVAKAERVTELADLSRGSVGTVISLALSSSMDASADEVIKHLRQARPTLPLLFTALLPYAKARESLERIGKQAGLSPKVLGLDDGGLNRAELGSPTGFLYLSKDDLAGPDTRQQATHAIRRHFGLDRR